MQPSSNNLLHVSVETVVGLTSERVNTSQIIVATTADRYLNILSTTGPTYSLIDTKANLHDSPILSCTTIAKRFLFSTSWSGLVVLYDLTSKTILDQRRDHQKYV